MQKQKRILSLKKPVYHEKEDKKILKNLKEQATSNHDRYQEGYLVKQLDRNLHKLEK